MSALLRPAQAETLSALRATIRRLEGGNAGAAGGVLLGLPLLDAALPEGGLACGRMHEVAGTGDGSETGFCAALLGRLPGPVLWLARGTDLYAPGLAAYGLGPERLLLLRSGGESALLQAMEDGLRCPGLAAVVGEASRLSTVAVRRLQLAAETGGTLGLLLRREAATAATGLTTRWRLAAAPAESQAAPPDHAGLPAPCWRVELLQCRGGRPGAWLVSWPVDGRPPNACPAPPLAHQADAPAETVRVRPRPSPTFIREQIANIA